MAPATVGFFLVCLVALSNGFLTRGRNLEPLFPKDTAVPQESQDVVENNLELEPAPVEIESVPQESSVMKQCAKIGEFVSILSFIIFTTYLVIS